MNVKLILSTASTGRHLPVLAMLLAACNPHPPDSVPASARAFDVPVRLVVRNTVPRLLPISGNVVASREILITAKVSGYLRGIPAEEGQEVGADELLAEIDPTQIDNAVIQSEASLKAARASVSDAQRDLARQKQLRDKGMVSEAALNKAALHLDQMQAELERTRSQLHSNRAERSYARITSPVRARVVQRLRQPGDLATPGQPVLRLQALEGVQFEANVPARDAGMLAIGQQLKVQLDDRDASLTGIVTHLISAADPITRTIKIKLALPSDSGIVPGMFGRVLVPQGNEAMVAIPSSALVDRLGVEGVFIADAHDNVRFVSVRSGKIFDGQVEIRAGLTGGEKLVLLPPQGLRDGDRLAHGHQ